MPRIDDRTIAQLHTLVSRITAGALDAPFQCPGVSLLIERSDGARVHLTGGSDVRGAPVREDSLFTLASATKLASGMAVLRLVSEGRLELDAPLARYLPEAAGAGPGVTIRRMMSHTAGLALDITVEQLPYTSALTWRDFARVALETPPALAPGVQVLYSNVGYALLAQVVERATDLEFSDALRALVLDPLGIEAYFGTEPPRRPMAIYDLDSPYEGTEIEPANSPFWRRLAMPWAGLITTADGLLALLHLYEDSRTDLVAPWVTAEARADQTDGRMPGGFDTLQPFYAYRPPRSKVAWPRCAWGLAVEVRGDKRPHWTPLRASPESYGAIGSSGVLAWSDPPTGVSWAILGTRSTINGWLLRHAAALGAGAMAASTAGSAAA